MRAALIPLCVTPLLAGCDLGSYTDSGFRAAGTSGIPVTLNNQQKSSLSGPTGTVHYTSGTEEDKGAIAFAGISSVGDVGVAPATTTFYTTIWEVTSIGSIKTEGQFLSGTNEFDGGAMILTFDPGTGEITGSGAGAINTLEVDGRIDGTDLEGGVTYAGVDGDLTGDAGNLGLIGAFHGHSEERVFSGGLRSVSVSD